MKLLAVEFRDTNRVGNLSATRTRRYEFGPEPWHRRTFWLAGSAVSGFVLILCLAVARQRGLL